ncbi:hypothetical protein [Mesorhizobium retamae]|uniref:DUF4926 domain-containing protein n=1 Tax=Mesorhizobium retamae TaxID=2912854 RepID=A0ABS9QP78_9HYPH|nr:hypothetical protein [Mesorhizobium sp. IRAMC:0171]MCG7509268.1 hypothetical protein [Mesorhizobium sp. IRAMC:0171]
MSSQIEEYDVVRNLEAVEDIPAGTLGVVLSVYDNTHVEVEFRKEESQRISYTVSSALLAKVEDEIS